ncbi:MAG TPA: hypothetical protein VII67_04190 [Acidimicrobiales bacterium]
MATKREKGDSAKRAHRLIRFYPMSWRERYGDEFAAHMEQEIEDTPKSPSRTLNVMMKGLYTRAKNFTWRVIFMQPGDGKFQAGVLIPIAVIVGIAVTSFSGWPINGHKAWPAEVLIGVLFAFVVFGVIHDSHRIRTYGPAKRFSKDRLIPVAVILISTLPIIFHNEIGHTTLLLYVVLSLDLILFAYKFGWVGRRLSSINGPSTPVVRGNTKL